MPEVQFICPKPKCAYAIDGKGLNDIQLQVLRRWPKICPKCGQRAKFTEQTSLPNIQTISNQSNGGTQNAMVNQAVPKTASQRRRSDRHDGQH